MRTSSGRREVKKRDSATIETWEEKSITTRRSDPSGKGEVGVERKSLGYRKEEVLDNLDDDDDADHHHQESGRSRIIVEENKHEEKRWIKGDGGGGENLTLSSMELSDRDSDDDLVRQAENDSGYGESGDADLSSKRIKTLIPTPEGLMKYTRSPTPGI